MNTLKLIVIIFAMILLFFSLISSNHESKSVILIIGDGMGLPIISAYDYYKNEYKNQDFCNFSEFDGAFLVRTRSKDYLVTDSAAGATAFAIGKKVPNYQLGQMENNKRIPTIMDIAKQKGKSTGIVVECSITHATPAAFYSYSASRKDNENIAKQLIYSNLDIVIGGGYKYFQKHMNQLRNNGYHVIYGEENLDNLINSKQEFEKLIAFTAYDHPPAFKYRNIKLDKKLDYALRFLSKNRNGFFLLVEASQIDWYAHNNDIMKELDEMEDLDNAVKVALNYQKSNPSTLVLVLADHECGGISLVDTKANKYTPAFKVNYSSNDHTAEHIVAFYKGFIKPKPIVDNTQIYSILFEYIK